MCKFSLKMRVAETLACIGFTEILEVSDNVSEKSCKLKTMDYLLLPVGCFEKGGANMYGWRIWSHRFWLTPRKPFDSIRENKLGQVKRSYSNVRFQGFPVKVVRKLLTMLTSA